MCSGEAQLGCRHLDSGGGRAGKSRGSLPVSSVRCVAQCLADMAYNAETGAMNIARFCSCGESTVVHLSVGRILTGTQRVFLFLPQDEK